MNKLFKIFLVLFALIVIILGSGIGYYSYETAKNVIYPGIKVEGISLSNMKEAQAKKELSKFYEDENKKKSIKFVSDVTSYNYTLSQLGLKEDIDKAVKDAFDIGRSGNKVVDLFNVVYTGIMGKNIDIKREFDKKQLQNIIAEISEKVFVSIRNAEFSYINGEVKIVPERAGKYLDINETEKIFMENLDSKEIKLPIYKVDATLTSEDFKGINGLIGKFDTNYKSSESNRKDNIKLGAEKLSNMLIKPGQQVSFNETVGEISSNTGYKLAGVIINGEFDRGVGGGICQVSTTLYNALLRADMGIVERSNHTRPIAYVPKGTDAAVSSGYKDLKFVNKFDFPIYITSVTDGNIIEFNIFGDTSKKDYTVEIVPEFQGTSEPKVIKRYSATLGEGETKVDKEGSIGYYYKTYKKVVKNGEVVSTEQISTSSYPAQTKVVLYGPEKSVSEDMHNANVLKDNKTDSNSSKKSEKTSTGNSSKKSES